MSPPILLGVGATLLTLFIEFQLLQATDATRRWTDVARSQQAPISVELLDNDLAETNQPPLQVRARPIVPGPHTSFVSQSE
jgi:hypothetical protein